MSALHQFGNTGFPVGHINEPSTLQGQRCFGHALVLLRPAQTFPGPRARAVTGFLFARPHPGIGDTQEFAFRRHDIGGMQVQAALCLVGERTKAGIPYPLKSSSVLSCRQRTTGCCRILAFVWAMCGSRMSCHPSERLSSLA